MDCIKIKPVDIQIFRDTKFHIPSTAMLVCYRALEGPVTIEYYTTTSDCTNTNPIISEK